MSFRYIGKNIKRVDALEKVIGEAQYTGDIEMQGMLHVKVMRSPVAHANIRSIKTDDAKSLPGVVAVITYMDVPDVEYSAANHPWPDDVKDKSILAKKVRYVGDEIAAVAAETEEIAEKAIGLIDVDYEVLPAAFTEEESLRETAPIIHGGNSNIIRESDYVVGDIDEGFAQSDMIFEDEFVTPVQHACSIENHVCIANVDSEGVISIHTSTQQPHMQRRILSEILGIGMNNIRVIQPCVGGAFGNKQDMCQEPICAMLALKTRRPVRLEYTKEEELVVTRTRHSMRLKCKTGVMESGKISARKIEVISNTGAYYSHGHSVLYNQTGEFMGLYPAPHMQYKGKTYYSNIPIGGALRAYGIPQLQFAVESHMDSIAHKMNLDPIEFRLMNACKTDDIHPVKNIPNRSCGLQECINLGRALSGWDMKRKVGKSGTVLSGIGMACYSYANCVWPGMPELAGARITVNEDGSAILASGAVELGQGALTALTQIAAEELGISIYKIRILKNINTETHPLDYGAYASRQTYVSGNAVRKAARACKKDIIHVASRLLDMSEDNLGLSDDWVINCQLGEKLLPIKDVTMQAYYDKDHAMTIAHDVYHRADTNAVSYGSVFADIDVDTTTGKINIKKLWSVHDAGTIINPGLAEGQVHGGVHMGLGYALTEELLVDSQTGRILNNNMLDYKMLTFMDTPEVDVHFIETEEPSSCFGNKNIAEPPTICVAPAIRNAVLNAVGIEINQIPMTPERVYWALHRVIGGDKNE
jgi:xanthine dehydrogenase molybdenum-binding subunit